MPESRAEYFRERHIENKMFCAEVNRAKSDRFDKLLKEKHINKVSWLNSKIDEELLLSEK